MADDTSTDTTVPVEFGEIALGDISGQAPVETPSTEEVTGVSATVPSQSITPFSSIPIMGAQIQAITPVSPTVSQMSGGEPTLANLEAVYDACNTCQDVPGIAKITNLSYDIINKCKALMKKKGWVGDDDSGKTCNAIALENLRKKLTICASCCGGSGG